jgi:hypothetical protein
MEKDIGKIKKNDQSDIIIRVDDFGGKRGLTIREFVSSDRYTGFTKAGVRIVAEEFPKFKEMINSIDEAEMAAPAEGGEAQKTLPKEEEKPSTSSEELPDY